MRCLSTQVVSLVCPLAEMKPEKVEFERKPEKLSLRKELKRKCQGGDLISGPDDLSSPMGVGPVG